MNKLVILLFICLSVSGCDAEEAPDCFQTAGAMVKKDIPVASFEEVIVYERVKLFIEQGEIHKVVVETGQNLISEVSVKVENNRLSIRNNNACNLVRNYEITKVFVTTPDLSWLQNSSGSTIESIGTIKADSLWLRSENQARDLSIHTDGDFKLDLDVENLRITNDNYSNYFLTGKALNFNAFFAAGDGRLEAENLIVQNYNVFHRGTNKLIINPRNSLIGNIYSNGNIIAKNRPPIVNVTEHYRGRLIFE